MEPPEPPKAKRRKSDEGLFGLLGAYGSEEEEEESGAVGPAGDAPQIIEITSAGSPGGESPSEAAAVEEEEQELSRGLVLDPNGGAASEINSAQQSEKDPFWLPPEIATVPKTKCEAAIQDRIVDYIKKQDKNGITISQNLKALRAYKNPDFLQHSVEHDKVEQYGTCYPPVIFDPCNLPKEDYYERLKLQWEQFDEQRKKTRQRPEFVRGWTETVRVATAGLNNSAMVAQAKATAAARASKWDSSARR